MDSLLLIGCILRHMVRWGHAAHWPGMGLWSINCGLCGFWSPSLDAQAAMSRAYAFDKQENSSGLTALAALVWNA
jgi:hypothetical protein